MQEAERKRILAKLDEMSKYVKELREMIPPEEEYSKGLVRKRGCEKTVELAIDSLIDVAAMIVSSQKLGLPESEENIIDLLVGGKVITLQLGKKLKEMKGFRNILVHKYGKKDDSLVYKFLALELGFRRI